MRKQGRGAESRGKLDDDEKQAISDLSDWVPPTAQRHRGKPAERIYGTQRTCVQYEAVHRGVETRAELIEGGGP